MQTQKTPSTTAANVAFGSTSLPFSYEDGWRVRQMTGAAKTSSRPARQVA